MRPWLRDEAKWVEWGSSCPCDGGRGRRGWRGRIGASGVARCLGNGPDYSYRLRRWVVSVGDPWAMFARAPIRATRFRDQGAASTELHHQWLAGPVSAVGPLRWAHPQQGFEGARATSCLSVSHGPQHRTKCNTTTASLSRSNGPECMKPERAGTVRFFSPGPHMKFFFPPMPFPSFIFGLQPRNKRPGEAEISTSHKQQQTQVTQVTQQSDMVDQKLLLS